MRARKGDVGGQRTLRPYWRNYFEQTDAIVWVVDSGDRMRMQDCKQELHDLLLEDVSVIPGDIPTLFQPSPAKYPMISDWQVHPCWCSRTSRISQVLSPKVKSAT
jgi:hypothetical protein